MLGQLFRSLNAGRRRSTLLNSDLDALESVTEDTHTRALLWPDAESLGRQEDGVYPFLDGEEPGKRSGFDLLDPDAAHKIRILIAQDEIAGSSKSVLYDSKRSETPAPPTQQVLRRGSANNAAQGTLARSLDTSRSLHPTTPSQVAALPRSNLGGNHTRTMSGPSVPRPLPEQSGSLFTRGRSSFPAAVPETSPVPTGRRTYKDYADDEVNTCLDCMFGNTALSYTGSSTKIHWIPAKDLDSPSGYDLPGMTERKFLQTALVTRIFSVDIDDEITQSSRDDSSLGVQAQAGQQEGIPFSESTTASKQSSTPKAFKRRKPPSYAIGLLIQVGGALPKTSSPKLSKLLHLQDSLTSNAPHDFPSLASSVDSVIQMSWSSIFEDVSGGDHMTSSGTSVDSSDGDILTEHWEIILRILANLQIVATKAIHARLTSIDAVVLDGSNEIHSSQNTKSLKIQTIQTKTLKLGAQELAESESIQQVVNLAKQRIEQAVCTRYVIVGQDRWSIWREEARWISDWVKQKEKASFLRTVLTSFLSIHTEWLDLVRMAMPKDKRQLLPKLQHDIDAVRARTVIISPDRAVSRRLIFLLSSFVSGPQSRLQTSPRLRNRRAELTRQISSVTIPEQSSEIRTSLDSQVRHIDEVEGDMILRKPRSSMSVQRLPDSGISLTERRGSSSTLKTTQASNNSTPVAHFVIPQPEMPLAAQRRDSNGGLASSKLSRSLQAPVREERLTRVSSSSRAPSSYRWGSLASFWNHGQIKSTTPPRRTSQSSDLSRRKSDTPASSATASNSVAEQTQSKLASVTTLENEEMQHVKPEPVAMIKGPNTKPSRRNSEISRPGSSDLPVKLSVNEKDGVIDIDVTSLKADSSSLENLINLDFFQSTGEDNFYKADFHHSNVAGYLPVLNQDVSIQAVRPYDDLKRHVKRAMSAEPTPSVPRSKVPPTTSSMDDRISLATTLIIDLRTMTVKRLCLTRHIRLRSSSNEAPPTPAHRRRDAVPAYIPETLGESFTEELITSASSEPVLAKVLERLLFVQSHASGPQTREPSLSGSVKQGMEVERVPEVSKAVSRQDVKSTVIAALSEITEEVLTGAASEPTAKSSMLRESLRKIVKEQKVVA